MRRARARAAGTLSGRDRLARVGHAIVGIVLCLIAAPAFAQETREEPPRGGAPEQAPPSALPPSLPAAQYPLELLGLLTPSARRGGVTLMPSISVSEEYNDNIFSDNRNKEWEFITGFGPAITLTVNRPSFALSAGYSFTAELYAREDRNDQVLARQSAIFDLLYRATPTLTLTLFDSFSYNRNTDAVSAQGISTGRQESWSNTFTPGVNWAMTPQDSLNLAAMYSVLRFQGVGTGIDSDTYRVEALYSHAFTPRFTGMLGYGGTYLDFRTGTDATVHTPYVGARYRFTPTLTGTIRGGPAIVEQGDETILAPAGSATLVQEFAFGSASLDYVRSVGAAGGLGGASDTQTASATLTLTTLARGLFVAFRPAYTVAESLGSRQTSEIDVRAFTLNLSAFYQIGRFVNLFAGYTFLHQRTGGSSSTRIDVDQNRVTVGLQFGYPFHFD